MNWGSDKVAQILEELRALGDDFINTEAKRATKVPEDLPTTICAFANMPEGGTVLLGVDEKTNFSVVGVADPAKIIKSVISQTRQTVEPAPQIISEVITVEDKDVVALTVLPLDPEKKPARYRGKAYLRQSDGEYEMNVNDLQLIRNAALLPSKGFAADAAAVPDTTAADLDKTLVETYVKSAREASRRLATVVNDNDLLRIVKVISPDGTLSIAGLYGLGFFPQGPEPVLRVTAAVRRPEGSGEPRNRNIETFDGAVSVLLQDAVDWIVHNSDWENVYLENGHMRERSEFPLTAIREIVANALVHRDLSPASLGGEKRKWSPSVL